MRYWLIAAAVFFAGPATAKGKLISMMTKQQSVIQVMTTSGTKRLSKEISLAWQIDNAASKHEAVVVINPEKKFQKIDGFGGAFTDAACFNFNKMSASSRKDLFRKLFHPSELGLNVCRICVGASDYATEAYSYCDGSADPELRRFSIAHDKKYVLPVIREARQVNPQLAIFASPWSPPGWMKSNGSMLGGNMQRRYMEPYAKYFAKFIRAFAEEGVPIDAVTVQNEVDTDQDGRMPACAWPQEYEVDFVANYLGPTFKKEGLKTKIWIIDHNYNMWGRALSSLESPELRKYVSGIAWHGYIGDVSKMAVVSNAHPKLGMHWTEGGPDLYDPNYAKNWSNWGKDFTAILRNQCRSLTVWNLSLDEEGKPNIGPFSCGGLVTINSKTGAVTYSGQYFALAHFSHAIKRGAIRIDSLGQFPDLHHVAFKNPDGTCAAILTNTGKADRSLKLKLGNRATSLKLAPDSVTTLTW